MTPNVSLRPPQAHAPISMQQQHSHADTYKLERRFPLTGMTSQIQVESSNSGHPDAGGTENLLTAQVVKKGVSASPYGVDGLEERQEVFLGVDVLLTVGREKDILPFLKVEASQYVACLDILQVVVKHLRHR